MPILRLLVIILVIVNLVLLSLGLGWLGRNSGGEGDRLSRQIAADKVRLVRDQAPAPAPVPAPETPTAAAAAPATATVTPAPAPAAAPANVAAVAAAAEAAAKAAAAAQAAKIPSAAVAPVATAPAVAAAKVPAPPAPAAKAPAPPLCKLVPTVPLPLAEKAQAILKGLRDVKTETKDIPAARASFWVNIPPHKNRAAADARVEDLKAKGVQDFFIVQEEGPNRYAISLGLYRSETIANDYLNRLKKKGVTQAVIKARGGEAKRDLMLRGPANAVEGAIAKLAAELGELRTGPCEAP